MIQNLDASKGHDHGNISIHMLQLCSNSNCKPLELFSSSLWKVILFRLNAKKKECSCNS